MVERCPRCGYRFEREQGFIVGGMAINIVVTEGLLAVFLVVSLIATWPDPPVAALIAGAIALNLVVPILFYPFSKTIWAAFDLLVMPLDAVDEAEAIVAAADQRRSE